MESFCHWLQHKVGTKYLTIHLDGMPAHDGRSSWALLMGYLPPSLETLDIRLQSTVSLEEPLFPHSVPDLQCLMCSGDVIVVNSAVGKLKRLQTLVLGSSYGMQHQLLMAPKSVPAGLKELHILNCHPLFRLPGCLENCSDLETLSLVKVVANRGYALEDWTRAAFVPTLKRLDVSSCEWRAVPGQISGLIQLERLNLADCLLRNAIEEGMSPLPLISFQPLASLKRLEYLNIRGCQLTMLDPVVFTDLPNLHTLCLGRNPRLSLPPGVRSQIHNIEMDVDAALSATHSFSLMPHLKRVAFTPPSSVTSRNGGHEHLFRALLLHDGLKELLFCTHTVDRMQLQETGVASLVALSHFRKSLRIKFSQGDEALQGAFM